jgi:hypothetical protein
MENVFKQLEAVNVDAFTEKKDTGRKVLTYLSWANAWAEVARRFPDASYTIKKFENNLPFVYDPKTGYMVFTEVTIGGVTHEMWLPVMDGHNMAMLDHPYEVQTKKSTITVQACTMFDINTTIMRCLTKNLGMFGLGLYIYRGEDFPQSESNVTISENNDKVAKAKEEAKQTISPQEIDELTNFLREHDVRASVVYKLYKVKKMADLTTAKYNNIHDHIDDIKAKQEEMKAEIAKESE